MLGRITVALFFLLLVWGNMVAGMKAGLACPDWPLCQGRVVPPFRLDIYMEFTHRVIGAVASSFLVALSYVRFRAYRGRARLVPAAAVCLLAAEIVMGGLVVLLGIPVQLTTVHFMVGLGVFVLSVYMMVFDGTAKHPAFPLSGPAPLFLGVGALVYSQAALGAYMRHSDAGLACPDFPTCLGRIIPPVLNGPVLVHFSHRALGVIILLTMVALYASARVDERLRNTRGGAAVLLILMLMQLAVGAVVVLSGLYFAVTALHLALALVMLYVSLRMWANAAGESGVSP